MEKQQTSVIGFAIEGEVNGIPIKPDTMDFAKLREFFNEVDALLRKPMMVQHAADSIHLTEYTGGSIKIKVVAAAAAIMALNADLATLARTSSLAAIHPDRAAIIERFQRKAKDGYNYKVYDDSGRELVSINKKTNYLPIENEVFVNAEQVLYGEIIDMGGQKPNIHLLTECGETLVIACKKEDLINQARLYTYCGILVRGLQNVENGAFKSAEFVDFVDYEGILSGNALHSFVEKGTKTWAGIDSLQWQHKMRGYA
jgi:hypothetical protein